MKFVDSSFQLSASDLSNNLSCSHLTQLNRKLALREIKPPTWHDPSLDVLIQRGQEHEDAYVAHLKKKGLNVVNLNGTPMEATIDAMKSGAEVIVQAKLDHGIWMGYADILMKVEGKSKFGSYAYEVQDTKLAQDTRASAILQLCLYSDLLTTIQETAPEKLYVVKPGDDFPAEAYRLDDFLAYYRLAKKNFEIAIAGPPQLTYPDPVEHCNICRWWQVCSRKRKDDDHLSLVAGIRGTQIQELEKQEIETLEQFAKAKRLQKPERGNPDSLVRKQPQAKIQLKGREEGKLLHEFIKGSSFFVPVL